MVHGQRPPVPHGLSDLRAVDEETIPRPVGADGAGRGVPPWLAATLNYCSRCGAALRLGPLPGDDRTASPASPAASSPTSIRGSS